VHQVGFTVRIITMHGHLNVKFPKDMSQQAASFGNQKADLNNTYTLFIINEITSNVCCSFTNFEYDFDA